MHDRREGCLRKRIFITNDSVELSHTCAYVRGRSTIPKRKPVIAFRNADFFLFFFSSRNTVVSRIDREYNNRLRYYVVTRVALRNVPNCSGNLLGKKISATHAILCKSVFRELVRLERRRDFIPRRTSRRHRIIRNVQSLITRRRLSFMFIAEKLSSASRRSIFLSPTSS